MNDDARVWIVESSPTLTPRLDEVMPEGREAKRIGSADALDAARASAVMIDDACVGGSGIEVLEALRARGLECPLILVTDHGRAPRMRARRAGIAIYTKPVATERLARSLRCVLSKKRPPRLECSACHSTTNLAPPSVQGFVFFCGECRAVAGADPRDPMVDVGGPGGA